MPPARDRSGSHVVAVVQARMTSSRLPGKALAQIDGSTALALLFERLSRAHELDGIVLATSVELSDDPVAAVGADEGIPVVRGPLDDVLRRFALALDSHPADAVVRITGDCPVCAPDVVDAVVRRWRESDAAYVSNTIEPRTFPDGLDVEVLDAAALRAADVEAADPADREHVTSFVRERPGRFPQRGVYLDRDYGDVRITLDTAEDLEQIRRVVAAAGRDAGLAALLRALGLDPHATLRD